VSLNVMGRRGDWLSKERGMFYLKSIEVSDSRANNNNHNKNDVG